jgi:uncharacterized RDD family membrane protein YckC
VTKKIARTYDAHETDRMMKLHGALLATFKQRAVAFFVDFFLAAAVFMVIVIPGSKLAERLGFAIGDVHLTFDFSHWYSFVFLVVYFTLWTFYTNGRSVGKMLMHIRVVSLVHEKMSFWHSLERSLGYGASSLEFGFGFLQYFTHPNRKTVHDRIAETIVIQEKKGESVPGGG